MTVYNTANMGKRTAIPVAYYRKMNVFIIYWIVLTKPDSESEYTRVTTDI